MNPNSHPFKVGDRVCAKRRVEFPDGVIVQVLDKDYLLVRWNGNLLETVHRTDIERIEKR